MQRGRPVVSRYNSSTGASQWQQPAELVMSPTSLSKLQSTDPTNATKLKQVRRVVYRLGGVPVA